MIQLSHLGPVVYGLVILSLSHNTDSLNCRQQALKWHNHYRTIHQVGNVTWSNKLAQQANKWATYLANNNKFEHEKSNQGNLFLSPGKPKEPCTRAVQLFYTEEKNYNYKKPQLSTGAVGHFTQVVWKNTKQIGAVSKVRRDGKTVVVVKYFPGGNVGGQNLKNVFPPRKPTTARPNFNVKSGVTRLQGCKERIVKWFQVLLLLVFYLQ